MGRPDSDSRDMPRMLASQGPRPVSLPSMRRASRAGRWLLAAAAAVVLVGAAQLPAYADTAPTAPSAASSSAPPAWWSTRPARTRCPRSAPRPTCSPTSTTGEVLAAKDPHGRLRPASTLKMLTALTLLPELDPAEVYTAQWEDANVEGSRAGLVPDATYTVRQPVPGAVPGVRQRRGERAGQRGRRRARDGRRDERHRQEPRARWTPRSATRAAWTRRGSTRRRTTSR